MTDTCKEINEFGKGIGNESRYRILQALLKEQKTVGELVKTMKLSQPAVSQHLKILKGIGLVADERHGQEVVYSVNVSYMAELLKKITTSLPTQHGDLSRNKKISRYRKGK